MSKAQAFFFLFRKTEIRYDDDDDDYERKILEKEEEEENKNYGTKLRVS